MILFVTNTIDARLIFNRYADKGHEVVGIEFVEKAVLNFFETYKVDFDVIDCAQIHGKQFQVMMLDSLIFFYPLLFYCHGYEMSHSRFQSKDEKIRIYRGDLYLFSP